MGAAVAEVERQVARSFLTTARCASFKQAARSLNLPPMVLRRQLQRLEKTVGEALFVYQERALALTVRGRSLQAELAAQYQDLRPEAALLENPSFVWRYPTGCSTIFWDGIWWPFCVGMLVCTWN